MNYDKDSNEDLDKEEARDAFINVLNDIKKGELYSQNVFDILYEEADEDKNGKISKQELKNFFKKYKSNLLVHI